MSGSIVAHVQDNLEGVNASTLQMKVDDVVVSPQITGSPTDLTVTYTPTTPLSQGQTVVVSLDAQDLGGNAMPTETYLFRTSMDTIPQTNFSLIKINFQPPGLTPPDGYITDEGDVIGLRASGYRYGWDQYIADDFRSLDGTNSKISTLTGTNIKSGDRKWEIEVPNGQYTVHILGVDTRSLSNHIMLDVEGVPVVDGTGIAQGTQLVTVSDGRLTVTNNPNSEISSTTGRGENVINYIEIAEGDNDPTSARNLAQGTIRPLGVQLSSPFRPMSRIQYNLPQQGHVKAEIFNPNGQLVNTLVDRAQAAGSHNLRWNGQASDGQRMPNGLYTLRLRSGGNTLSQRFLLMR